MTKYKIDPAHSEILFKVKHLMISTVTGTFTKFDATMTSDKEDFSDAKVSFEADVTSVTTHNAQRDAHLLSDDFFNAEKFPKLKFESSSIEKTSNDTYKLNGILTIRDVSHEVTLDVNNGGTMTDPWGNVKVGFELTGKINRKDFGLKWHAVTEAGGLVAGDEVKLVLNIQMAKAA